MKTTKLIISTLLLGSMLTSCKIADLRTKTLKKEGITKISESKGKKLLETARQKQGMDAFNAHTTYNTIAEDHWKGMLGKMGKLWPQSREVIDLKFATGTFDASVHFTEGKKEGLTAGQQSWNYYEIEKGSTTAEFIKKDKRKSFGLAAYQYFFELSDRLSKAPIISYAGEKEFNGYQYDLVFVTWQEAKQHKEHDQYLAYINKSTGLMEYCAYTLRDNYLKMPGSGMLYGSIQFADLKEIDGAMIPMTQYVYFMNPKKNTKKYLHKLSVQEFKFDSFDKEELYPNKKMNSIGDSKL